MFNSLITAVRNGRLKSTTGRKPKCDRRLGYEGLETRLPLSGTSIVGGDHFETIQGAIDNASPGDTIRIEPGIYRESVDLSRMGSATGGKVGDLTLLGLSRDVTIRTAFGRAMYNSSQFTGNLTISGIGFTSRTNTGFDLDEYVGNLRIVGSRFNDNFENGIEVANATGQIRILNSQIIDARQKGIALSDVRNVVINNVAINSHNMSTEDGIRGVNIDTVRISNSSIRLIGDGLADDGIDLKDPTGRVTIANNRIANVADDGAQIEVNGSNNVSVRIIGNRISGNPQTFATTRGGIDLRTNNEGTIKGLISRNVLVGLNDHAIEVVLKDASQQSLVVYQNRVRKTNLQSAVVFDAAGTSSAKVDFARNTIAQTKGEGLRVIAEDASTMRIAIRGNRLRNIGDGSGDNAIQIQTDDNAGAIVNSRIARNNIGNVRSAGLYLRGLGSSIHNVSIIGNTFANTNIASGDASVLLDDENAGDATAIHAVLRANTVDNSNGANAYELNQRVGGIFTIVGEEATAHNVVKNNNEGLPVAINGTVTVIPPA